MSADSSNLGQRASRHLPIAERLTGLDQQALNRKFRNEPVLITGDPARLRTRSGQLMVELAANLTSRFCQRIDLALEDGPQGMGSAIEEVIARIDSTARTRRLRTREFAGYAGVLSVGSLPVAAPNVTTIYATGWVAIISTSGSISTPTEPEDGNPLGALAAATLGAAELFKRLVKPRPEKAGFFGDISFSTYGYNLAALGPEPALPSTIALPPSVLAGAGAVGNAFLLSLREVPGLWGTMAVVDSGFLDDPSNLNRYVLADESDLRRQDPLPKTTLATRAFAGRRLAIREIRKDVGDIPAEIESAAISRPVVVVSALDNNDARYIVQNLWPDVLIEGATGETVAQVSRHAYAEGLGCLRCIHPLPLKVGDYEERIRRISGLPLAWVRAAQQNPDLQLAAEAVLVLNQQQRELLAPLVGKPACSVLSEIERLSSRSPGELPFEPTVSFVSMMAGILAAAEIVKEAAGLGTPLKTFFQADLMFPLENAFLQTVRKVAGCYCVERAEIVRHYRQLTAERAGSLSRR